MDWVSTGFTCSEASPHFSKRPLIEQSKGRDQGLACNDHSVPDLQCDFEQLDVKYLRLNSSTWKHYHHRKCYCGKRPQRSTLNKAISLQLKNSEAQGGEATCHTLSSIFTFPKSMRLFVRPNENQHWSLLNSLEERGYGIIRCYYWQYLCLQFSNVIQSLERRHIESEFSLPQDY